MNLSSLTCKIFGGLVTFTFAWMVSGEPNEHAMDHGQHPAPQPGIQMSQNIAPMTTSAVSVPTFLSFL